MVYFSYVNHGGRNLHYDVNYGKIVCKMQHYNKGPFYSNQGLRKNNKTTIKEWH